MKPSVIHANLSTNKLSPSASTNMDITGSTYDTPVWGRIRGTFRSQWRTFRHVQLRNPQHVQPDSHPSFSFVSADRRWWKSGFCDCRYLTITLTYSPKRRISFIPRHRFLLSHQWIEIPPVPDYKFSNRVDSIIVLMVQNTDMFLCSTARNDEPRNYPKRRTSNES